MGLGKTIQGVGVAELLAREAGIRKVLVVCPASLKSQWRSEIQRFCDRDVQLVGGADRRAAPRSTPTTASSPSATTSRCCATSWRSSRCKWDLIILDEGQRIKNWESKTSRVIKGLRSRFALVLSGTPLENRLDDLYSVVQFIDDRRLGPGFRFFNQAPRRRREGQGAGLQEPRASCARRCEPVLLRRTRDSVRLELPPRTTEIVRIPPTDEQAGAARTPHADRGLDRAQEVHHRDGPAAAAKGAADVPHVGRQHVPGRQGDARLFDASWNAWTSCSSELFDEEGRKVVLFSEWTTMLDLIEPLLKKRKLEFVRLDGSVPQKQRQELVHEFQTDPDCRLFLTTNAGSTGLNLQAANTVINVDLPWNPAVLEQRIARAHRMGQTQPVQVYRAGDRGDDRGEPAGDARGQEGPGPGGARCRSRTSTRSNGQRHGRAEEAGWKCCSAPSPKRRSTKR